MLCRPVGVWSALHVRFHKGGFNYSSHVWGDVRVRVGPGSELPGRGLRAGGEGTAAAPS